MGFVFLLDFMISLLCLPYTFRNKVVLPVFMYNKKYLKLYALSCCCTFLKVLLFESFVRYGKAFSAYDWFSAHSNSCTYL